MLVAFCIETVENSSRPIDQNLSFSERLNALLQNSEMIPDCEPVSTNLKVINCELAVFRDREISGENLKMVRRNLEMLKPSSIDSERTFCENESLLATIRLQQSARLRA